VVKIDSEPVETSVIKVFGLALNCVPLDGSYLQSAAEAGASAGKEKAENIRM
jgi:hypothetical protein